MSLYSTLIGIVVNATVAGTLYWAYPRGVGTLPGIFLVWSWLSYATSLTFIAVHLLPLGTAALVGAVGASALLLLMWLVARRKQAYLADAARLRDRLNSPLTHMGARDAHLARITGMARRTKKGAGSRV